MFFSGALELRSELHLTLNPTSTFILDARDFCLSPNSLENSLIRNTDCEWTIVDQGQASHHLDE